MKNILFKFTIIYISILSLCIFLLVLSFSFDGNVNRNAYDGIKYIENNNKYPKLFQDYLPVSWKYLIGSWSDYLQADRPTEGAMLRATIKPNEDILNTVMIPSYARYWHGYIIIIRPLLNFIDYIHIKYLGIIFHCIGLFYVYKYTAKISIFWQGDCFYLLFCTDLLRFGNLFRSILYILLHMSL